MLKEGGERKPDGPLAGVTVIDLGGYIAGTFAPTVLAAFGANVVKVEALDGDPFRFAGLVAVGHNQGKRSLAIDLKHPKGREALHQMVRSADLVLDNFRAGVLERLGLDYETLNSVNPDIICCSVTGYGRGAMRERPGFDPLVQAESGMMAAQGGPKEPIFYQLPITDESTAIMAAFGMVTALVARQRTGKGQGVETCLANQSVLLQSGELTWYEGRPEAPIGDMDCLGESAMQRLYECADGWVALACRTTTQFQQLAAGMGHPEWVALTTAEEALRAPRDGELAETVAEAFASMGRDEVLDRLLTRGAPVAPAFGILELGSSDWFEANERYMETDHPQFGPVKSVSRLRDVERYPGGLHTARTHDRGALIRGVARVRCGRGEHRRAEGGRRRGSVGAGQLDGCFDLRRHAAGAVLHERVRAELVDCALLFERLLAGRGQHNRLAVVIDHAGHGEALLGPVAEHRPQHQDDVLVRVAIVVEKDDVVRRFEILVRRHVFRDLRRDGFHSRECNEPSTVGTSRPTHF